MDHKTWIPKKHFLALQKRKNNKIPLGFMTPDGDNKAAEKRKQTARDWAKGYRYQKDVALPEQTLDNELMEGFRISRSVRRWYTSNVVWRVEDPRGFELEISSDNLANLLFDTKIEGGRIEGKLIWARHGANNVLLHEDSKMYKEALNYTNHRLNKKVSLRDIEVGNTVIFNKGREGKYLGYFNIVERNTAHGNFSLTINNNKRHLFYVEPVNDGSYQSDKGKIIMYSSPKISEITDGSTEDIVDTESFIFDQVNNHTSLVQDGHGSSQYNFIAAVSETPEFQYGIEKLGNIDSARKSIVRSNRTLFAKNPNNGNWYLLNLSNDPRNNVNFYDQGKIRSVNDFLSFGTFEMKNLKRYRGGMGRYSNTSREEIDFDSLEWYDPFINVTNPKTNKTYKVSIYRC